MSTRSIIAIEYPFPSGYRAIYCHYDGYPTGVGKVLFGSYNRDNIEKLLDLGSLSSLGDKLEPYEGEAHSFDNPAPNTTVAYHRDRGEDWDSVKPVKLKSLSALMIFAVQSDADWLYLLDMETGFWRVAEVPPVLVSLDRVIVQHDAIKGRMTR